MTPCITLEELLVWNEESAAWWNDHLTANPALLELPCTIGNAATVQGLVRHIWAGELRMTQRLAAVPVTASADIPKDPFSALFGMHVVAAETCRQLLDDPQQNWEATMTMEYDWLPPHARSLSRRKMMAHTLIHGHRHWAQLSTVVRTAGSPADFMGDLIFSLALR